MDLKLALAEAGALIAFGTVLVTLTLLIPAAIDVPYQIYEHNKKMKMTTMLFIFVAVATLIASCAAGWTVRNDTDWTSNCRQNPYGKGKSAVDCADQCQKRADCAAVSWNGPRSAAADSFCNFKCSTGWALAY